MRIPRRLIKALYKLFLPITILLLLAFLGVSLRLIHIASHPPKASYLITPDKYGRLSARGARITDETWSNSDGTLSRGWLLRGVQGKPAIILLHHYGADRSYVLNLGVKLNEATDFTILMPDLRGHGQNPLVSYTTLGDVETDDVLDAIDFLKSLKTPENTGLISNEIGIYGVELGAFAGFRAASKEDSIKALVLDSVPLTSDEILYLSIRRKYPFAASYTSALASKGAYFYLYGKYTRDSLCDVAPSVKNRKMMLLAGIEEPLLQDSTQKLVGCFGPGADIQFYTGLTTSGYSLVNASPEQGNAYDQRVIDFFKKAFGVQTLPELNQLTVSTQNMTSNPIR
jgi:pimeloyl-ACP methyl ester carboxylesterase